MPNLESAEGPGTVERASAAPVAPDTRSAPGIDAFDAHLLLHGLGLLADLLNEASDTLNQCLLTIEDKFQALPTTQEQWIPIRAAEFPAPRSNGDQMRQRVFGGVAVTILKLDQSASNGDAPQGRSQHELGYATVGAARSLVIRPSAAYSSEQAQPCDATGLQRLRDVPLELRLRAIREIPALFMALDVRGPDPSAVESPAGSHSETAPAECSTDAAAAVASTEAAASGGDETPAENPDVPATEAELDVQHGVS